MAIEVIQWLNYEDFLKWKSLLAPVRTTTQYEEKKPQLSERKCAYEWRTVRFSVDIGSNLTLTLKAREKIDLPIVIRKDKSKQELELQKTKLEKTLRVESNV